MSYSDRFRETGRRISFARSGLVTALCLALAFAVLGGMWTAHVRGRLHRLSTPEAPPESKPPVRPGGQDIVSLHRSARSGGISPEITSADVLPGDGMAILQTTVALPGRGDVPLLLGTPLSDVGANLEAGTFAPEPSLQTSELSVLSSTGNGGSWSDPRELLRGRPAQQSSTDVLPGGAGTTATFTSAPAANGSGKAYAPSGIETRVSVAVTSRGFDLTVNAKNVGDSPRAVVIAWHPWFLAPDGNLGNFALTPPPVATGQSSSSAAAPLHQGSHHRYDDLKYSYMSLGPELLLRNVSSGYTLKMTALSPSIRSVSVDAAPDGKAVQVAFSTAAGESPQANRTIIAPSESLEWRLRIEAVPDSTYKAKPAN